MANLIERHREKIVGVLSCFDRLVLQGSADVSPGEVCAKCQAEAIWENKRAAACRSCGTHGEKRAVVAAV